MGLFFPNYIYSFIMVLIFPMYNYFLWVYFFPTHFFSLYYNIIHHNKNAIYNYVMDRYFKYITNGHIFGSPFLHALIDLFYTLESEQSSRGSVKLIFLQSTAQDLNDTYCYCVCIKLYLKGLFYIKSCIS